MSPDDPVPDSAVPLTPAPVGEPEGSTFVPDEYEPFPTNPATRNGRPGPAVSARSRLRMWLIVGGVLWAIGLAGWLLLFVQGCESDGDPGPAVKKKK